METKRCSTYHVEKPLSEFFRDKSRPGGHHSRCKQCYAAYRRLPSTRATRPTLLVNWFKGISARIYNHRWGAPYIRWTNSYYVGTAGTVTSETIKRYIEEQKSK